MTLNITTALVGILISLIGALVAVTWRSSALATRLLDTVKRLEDRDKEQDARLHILDDIPAMRVDIEHLKRNHSLIPKLAGEVEVLKAAAQFSKEMRGVMLKRISRPDPDEE